MCLRIAKIHEHAIAHVFRHEPAKPLHSLGDTLLIAGNDLAEVLRVHARREYCRTDKVREHHCDLAALASSFRGQRRRCRVSRLRWRARDVGCNAWWMDRIEGRNGL
jgi:hypothetical protein